MELTLNYVLSQIFIIINYILLVATYQVKSRKKVLILNLMGLISTAMSYAFLSAYTGLAMSIVSIIRNGVFLIDETKNKTQNNITKKDIFILISLILLSLIFTIITYNGPFCIFSSLAMILYTYSIWQKNNKVYKILGIFVEIFGLIYNIYIKSIFGSVLELILLIAEVIACLKMKDKKIVFNKLKK